MTFRMTKLPIDGFDGDLEEQETGVLNEGCSIDMACCISRNNTVVQAFCDFKTMLKARMLQLYHDLFIDIVQIIILPQTKY